MAEKMEWRFKQQTPNDTLTSATHLEFFRDDALNSKVRALVREDIQNRLDAHNGSEEPVRVRYHFSGENQRLAPKDAAKYFRGLEEHLRSPESVEELDTIPNFDVPVSFLTIEDFNTRGLEGDPTVTVDPNPEDKERNDYFWFIRNVGRSKKKGSDRGRWGLGKIVYPATSHMRSFFAYSIRESDSKHFLIGRSVLATHRIGNHLYDSEGYFGAFVDPAYEYNASPIYDAPTLEQFRKDFCISRVNEPGLSLVVPLDPTDAEDPINQEVLVESVLEYYYWIILRGDLTVEVSTGESPPVYINKDNISEVVRDWPNHAFTLMMNPRLNFAASAGAWGRLIELKKPASRASWGKVAEWFSSDEELADARAKFMRGETLKFIVPVSVRRKGATENIADSFIVLLKNDNSSERHGCDFLREGLAISGLRNHLREPGVHGLLLVGESATTGNPSKLSELLGDSENPAHTRWLPTTKHFRRKYVAGQTILKTVCDAPGKLAAILGRTDERIQRDLLKKWFSIPIAQPGSAPSIRPTPGDGPTVNPNIEVKPRNLYLRTTKISGGFRITSHPQASNPPKSFTVRAAYEVLRGSPWAKHHVADFDFNQLDDETGDLRIYGFGIEITILQNNRLRAIVTNEEFELRLEGFDTNRDLIVDARVEK